MDSNYLQLARKANQGKEAEICPFSKVRAKSPEFLPFNVATRFYASRAKFARGSLITSKFARRFLMIIAMTVVAPLAEISF